MTLEEAIIHEEEVAEGQYKLYDCYLQHGEQGDHVQNCLECAAEHRQLAEWLKELKSYKESRVGCEYCKHKFREQHERPCSLCQRNFMDMFESEVNADEESE